MTATPTSAKTAIHMLAMPKAARMSTANLMPRANTMFCHTMPMVLRATAMARAMERGIVIHQDHIGGLDGGVGAHGSHGDADVGAGEHRRIVDAVAHEGQLALAVGGLLGGVQQRLHFLHLVLGKQLGMHLVDTELRGHGLGHVGAVAGEHDRLLHAGRAQIGDGRRRLGLHGVGNKNVAGVGGVHGHVQYGAHGIGGGAGDMVSGHKLVVPHIYLLAVDFRFHATAADLFHAGDAGVIEVAPEGGAHRGGDGVGGVGLGQGRHGDEVVGAQVGGRANFRYGEGAVGEGAGLVEHHYLGGAQGLQVVRALH